MGGGGREVQERGDIGIPMADSCRCMAETNATIGLHTIVKKLPPIKKKKKGSGYFKDILAQVLWAGVKLSDLRSASNSPSSPTTSGLHWNPPSPLGPYITWGLDDSDSWSHPLQSALCASSF